MRIFQLTVIVVMMIFLFLRGFLRFMLMFFVGVIVVMTFRAAAFQQLETLKQAELFRRVYSVPNFYKEISFESKVAGKEKVCLRNTSQFPGGRRIVVTILPFLDDGSNFDMVASNSFEQPLIRFNRNVDERLVRSSC